MPVTDGLINSASVGAVAVSETNPDIVFIGTGETCIRGNIMPGDGVYKSSDAGKTWTHVGFAESHGIAKIRIHPTNPEVVFVASFGKYSVPSPERGVFKSTDGGKTWRRVLYRDDKTGAIDISIDRTNPNVMYAALWEAFRKEFTMSSGGPGSGLFKSTDGGETWTEITRNPGMPSGVIGRIGVAVSGASSNEICWKCWASRTRWVKSLLAARGTLCSCTRSARSSRAVSTFPKPRASSNRSRAPRVRGSFTSPCFVQVPTSSRTAVRPTRAFVVIWA